ncbi:MAG: hypothetical protein VX359_00150, partial [Chloroflexota bacterium]
VKKIREIESEIDLSIVDNNVNTQEKESGKKKSANLITWDDIINAVRHQKGDKYVSEALLKGSLPQIFTIIGKDTLFLNFKSNAMKRNFLDKMSIGSYRDRFLNTINDLFEKDFDEIKVTQRYNCNCGKEFRTFTGLEYHSGWCTKFQHLRT